MEQKRTFYKKHRTLFENSSVYNAQDVLKNHFLPQHPIVYSDKCNPLEAAKLPSDTGYVWLVKTSTEIERTFPLYFTPTVCENTVYQFPVLYNNTVKVKSWTDVQLVPTVIRQGYSVKKERNIVAYYDMYQGRDKFDIFYLGDTIPSELLAYDVQTASCIKEAQEKSKTSMLWIVPSDVVVDKNFKFNFAPDGWSFDFCHIFRNGPATYDGVILLNIYHNISKNEEAFMFFRNSKFVGTRASAPVAYDKFCVNSYEEYLDAASASTSPMFWVIKDDADTNDFNFNYHVAKYDGFGSRSTHVFLRKGEQLGVYLFTVDNLITKNEFEYNHYVSKIEVDLTPNSMDIK